MVGQSQRKVDGGKIPGSLAVPSGLEIKCNFMQPNGKPASFKIAARWVPPVVVGQALAESIANVLQPQWSAHTSSFCSTGTQFSNVVIRDMTDPTLPEFTSTGAAVHGLDTTGALPPDVAICVTGDTVTRGRGARGRFYLIGLGLSAMAPTGLIQQTCHDGINAMGTAWQSGLRGLNIIPSVAKPPRQEYIGLSGAHHDPRSARLDEVTAWHCRDFNFDTQRRRDIV
jgi:hypothetical protein